MRVLHAPQSMLKQRLGLAPGAFPVAQGYSYAWLPTWRWWVSLNRPTTDLAEVFRLGTTKAKENGAFRRYLSAQHYAEKPFKSWLATCGSRSTAPNAPIAVAIR